MENQKRKGGYASGPQTRRLIELLDADPELRSGKFSASFTYKTAQRRWCNISDELNAIGGPHKTWNEWRKTYHDKKSKTKKKASAQNRSARQTGGGNPAEELNDDEKLLLGSISSTQLSGHSDSEESRVMFRDLTNRISIPDTNNARIISIQEEIEQLVDPINIRDNIIVIQETNVEDNCEPLGQGNKTSPLSTLGVNNIFQQRTNTKPETSRPQVPRRPTKIKRSLDAAMELQRSLQEKNKIKKEYYDKKIEQMIRQANALEKIAASIAAKASPYI